MHSSDSEYFSKNYQHSRGVFLAGINQAAGPKNIGQWVVPGKKDNDLVVDHVYFQPTEKTETLFIPDIGIPVNGFILWEYFISLYKKNCS